MNRNQPPRRSLKKRQPRTTPARPHKRLDDILLALGGSRVCCLGPDPHAALIAARGQLFSQKVLMRRGQPHRCHGNAADLWAKAPGRYQLVTGYALSDQVWRSHSWVVGRDKLNETTQRFERYFGVVLAPLLACKFWYENFYAQNYPNNDPPPGFWEERPGIVALTAQFVTMPRKELSRLLTTYERGRCA